MVLNYILRRLSAFARKITRHEFNRVEDALRFYLSLSQNIIAIGLFSFIMVRKLDLMSFYDSDEALVIITKVVNISFWQASLNLIEQKWDIVFLSLFTIWWYFQYQNATKNELEVLVNLFPRDRAPLDWETVIGYRLVPLLAVGITICFIGLAYSVDKIPVYCFIVFVLNVFDLAGNRRLRGTLEKYLRDPQMRPSDSDPHERFLRERRQVAEDYWLIKPQIERISVLMMLNAFAFFLCFSQQIFLVPEQILHLPIAKMAPLVILAAAITLNETTMIKWRFQRDTALEKIESEEADEDRERMTQTDQH